MLIFKEKIYGREKSDLLLIRRVGIGNRNSGIKQTFWSTVMKSLQRDNVLKALYRGISGPVKRERGYLYNRYFQARRLFWAPLSAVGSLPPAHSKFEFMVSLILEKLDLQFFIGCRRKKEDGKTPNPKQKP